MSNKFYRVGATKIQSEYGFWVAASSKEEAEAISTDLIYRDKVEPLDEYISDLTLEEDSLLYGTGYWSDDNYFIAGETD